MICDDEGERARRGPWS